MAEFKASSHLYAGFLGGLTSSIILQPLDLLKTRVQQNGQSTFKSIKAITSPLELWRGTIPSALRMSIGASLYLTLLSKMRYFMARVKQNDVGHSSDLPRLSMHANLVTGALARAVVGLITMPFTVLKVRYESTSYKYSSLLQALKSTYAETGIRSFFSGYGVTITRDAPYAGLYVLFYEQSKDMLNSLLPASHYREAKTAAVINSTAAMTAATIASTITAPFDTIKTKIQLYPDRYPSLVKSCVPLLREFGVRHMFDGLALRLLRKSMSAGVSWGIYEELIRRFEWIPAKS